MRRGPLTLIGALLTGLLLAALFPRWGFPLLAPVALTPLLYVLWHEPSPKRRFFVGWLAGFLFWMLTCYWIRDVLDAYGGLNGPLSWLAQTLFGLGKGLHMALFAVLARPVMERWWAIPGLAALWTGIERTHGPLGFAWLTLGNAGIDMGLPLRLAPWVGVYGLSFVFALLGAALAMTALGRPRKQLLWLTPLLFLPLLPAIALKEAPKQSAAILQPNIAMDQPWNEAEKTRAVKQLSLLTLESALDPRQPKPALIAWPEVPAPFYYYADAQFRDHVTNVARLSNAPFVFGTVAYTTKDEPLNSAVLLTREGLPAGRYDKVKLVPFGEYIPPMFGWIQKISSEAGNYHAGERVMPFGDADHTLGTFICYESAFPDLVRQFAAQGAQVLVNLTNDGYFATSAARPQHVMLARMRAVENGRWLLRVANNGLTASIDPAGRVWDIFPEYREMAGRLRFNWINETTPYTKYGDWFAWLCLAIGLGLAVASQIPTYRPVVQP